MLSGVSPALPSSAEKAMAKHPACAAAISSSGFVPMPFSNRVLNEYCVSLSTPLSVVRLPFPSFNPPRQTADALRFIKLLLLVECESAVRQEINPPEAEFQVYQVAAAITKP